MRKILIILLSVSFYSTAQASLIEIEKCFSTKFTDSKKWTSEDHYRDNSVIKISKKTWKQNVEKFHNFKNEYGKDKDYYFKMIGIDTYPKISYVILNVFEYTADEIDKIKSLGGVIIKRTDRHVYSVDPEAGLVTEMIVYNDEFFNITLTAISAQASGEVNYEMTKAEMNSYKEIFNKKRDNGPIEIERYIINSYAGGLLRAKHEENIIGRQLVIDFNDTTIKKKIDVQARYTTYLCPNSISDPGSEESPGGSSGTAFFVSNKGHLLTNNHVVEGCSVSKISFKNKDYDAKLIATDKTLDLALLKANIRSSTYFSFSNEGANKLNKIYVAGFPLGKGLSDDLKISSGIVSSLKGFEDNSNEIQIDAPINPGNSGGPIIDESGELVAIAVSGLAKDQTEGINFGIKSSAAESFLISNNIKPKKSLYSRKLKNDKLLDILEKGTVYTYCN